jgi:hypothetical protein
MTVGPNRCCSSSTVQPRASRARAQLHEVTEENRGAIRVGDGQQEFGQRRRRRFVHQHDVEAAGRERGRRAHPSQGGRHHPGIGDDLPLGAASEAVVLGLQLRLPRGEATEFLVVLGGPLAQRRRLGSLRPDVSTFRLLEQSRCTSSRHGRDSRVLRSRRHSLRRASAARSRLSADSSES